MGKSFTLLGCASLLVLGCGDDSGLTPTEESSSGVVDPSTSTGPVGPSTSTGPADSTSTTEPGTTTEAVDSSSTGPTEVCGNDVIDGDDVCDGNELGAEDCVSQNFDAGTLACASDCSEYDTRGCVNYNCGNDTTEGKEACDGTDLGGATCVTEGFTSGTISCALNCGSLDTSDCGTCGNVVVDGDEACDDIVLFGQTCVSQGFTSGQLGCADDCLSFDTAGCGSCGNDLVDGTEFCDGTELNGADCLGLGLGYDSGTLACGTTCNAFDTSGCGTCGNGIADGDEFCDGAALGGESCVTQGFDNGALACNPACGGFDTSGCGVCGNGVIDGSENCDDLLLNGQTCASLGLIGGTLSCSPSCQYDFSACDIPGMQFGSDTGYDGYVIQGLAMLPCDDISATGTPTPLTDDSQTVVPIGFTFPVYGVDFTNVTIQSNGALHFATNTYMTLANTCLPTATNPSANNVYVFWDDLNPTLGASEVYYQTLGPVGDRRLVVQWDTAHYSGDPVDLIRVQAMLHEASGQIDVCYVDTLSLANIGNNGAEATSGIQQGPANGIQYSCNTPDLTNGTLLFYIPH